MSAFITAVSRSATHEFTKPNDSRIELVAGMGVRGDAHLGETVQHLVRVREDPTKPNLRQVHLIHSELFEELRPAGFSLFPGAIGENVTTRGIALLALPKDTRLHLGDSAVVQVTGLRNPCRQLDRFQPGLMAAMLDRDEQGNAIIKSGIMGIVLSGGEVKPGDPIEVELPPAPHQPLGRV
ncbi:MAG TPA: MOSC domain-containing protein [Micropepsaceae bacterium]|nr:MOSC domain-containing protein [Micropepsaceae bacterium]